MQQTKKNDQINHQVFIFGSGKLFILLHMKKDAENKQNLHSN